MKYHRSAVAWVCAMLACMATVRAVSAAESDRTAEGRAHFSRGVEYYKDGDFRNAMVEFKRAYELAPNYKLLYNLGQTGQELQDYALALRSLERYLAEGGSEIAADRRGEVSATIRKLKQRVAEVALTTNVSDAEVLVDDLPAGRTPLTSPLVVSAGRRKITVSKGSTNATRVIDVAGGERTELSLDLAAHSSKSAEPSALPGPQSGGAKPVGHRADPSASAKRQQEMGASSDAMSQPSESKTAVWIGVVATSALAVATGVTGGFALVAKRDFDATIDRYPTTPAEVADARDKTRKLALATDILGGAAILSCGITIWIAVASGKSSSHEPKRIGFTVAPNGLIAQGSF